MAKFSIIPKGGGTARYSGCPSFTGTYMKPGVLEFREIAVPSPIAWEVGDYVEYTRTGRTYRLYTVPQVKKQARSTEYGGAFVYQSVQFFDDSKQLEICPFRDLVPDDNRIHFSTQPAIAVFDNVAGIAERLQTCLVDMYGANSWVVRVATVSGDGISQDLADLMAEDRDFSVSGVNILQCLEKIYEVWPEVGWVYKIESGTNTIIIGGAGLNAPDSYQYGKGNGLRTITRNVANADELATRIFAYGSSRNMLPRWYNNQTIKDADSVDIQNLMLPVNAVGTQGQAGYYPGWGKTNVEGTDLPDPAKAYIDADDAAMTRLGLRPKTYYFDGSGDLPDIYPTIRKMTVKNVRDSKSSPSDPYYPSTSVYTDATVRVDTVLSAPLSFDSGLAGSSGGKETIFTDYKNSTATDSESVSGDVKIYTRSIFTESFSMGASVAGTRDISIAIDLSGTVQVTGIKGAKVTAYLRKGHPANAAIISREMKLEESTTAGTYIFVPFTLTGSRKVVEEATYYLVIDLEVELDAASSARTLAYDAAAGISASVQNYRETTFKLGIRQIGFDINEQANLGEGKTIAMRSGKCAGRSFVIKNCTYVSATDSWSLDVIRSEDESLSQWFPNSDYPILAGDEFVLLDIAMPDEYILVAERNLLAAAQELLADVSVERWQYTPEIDAKFMVENSRTLLPGENISLSDTDVVGNSAVSILIDSVTISENEAAIPTYKVTLRDRKRKTFTESKGADSISSNPVTKSSSQVAKEASAAPSVVSDSYFTLDENGNVTLKEAYQNLWVPGWLADGGIGTGGGGGGSSTLYGLNDVDIPVNPGTNDLLSYNGSVWVNVHKSDLLSGLATTQDLASKQDAYPFTITGVSGQTYDLSNLGVTVDSKDAEIGTTLTTLATVAGVDIKAKIPSIPSAPGTLVTNNTSAQTASPGESLSGTINLHKVSKTGNYNDLLNLPSIPTEQTVSGWGFTKNAGTITGITMNGVSKGTSGVVDLGTVVTTVSLSAGSSDGSLKLTVNGTAGSDVSVPGFNSLSSRVSAIEEMWELENIGTQESPVWAIHAKSNYPIYSDSWIADGGIGNSSGGGVDLARVWESLTNNTDEPNVKINIAHIPDITTGNVSDIESWITAKHYLSVVDGYTRDQVDQLVAGVNQYNPEIVATIPTAGVGTMYKLYFVGPDANNEYERYVTVEDNGSYSWVSLGSTALSLSGFASEDDLEQLDFDVNGGVTTFTASGSMKDLSLIIREGMIITALTGSNVNLYDENGQNQINITTAMLPYRVTRDYYKASTYVYGSPSYGISVSSLLDSFEDELSEYATKGEVEQVDFQLNGGTSSFVPNGTPMDLTMVIKKDSVISSVSGSSSWSSFNLYDENGQNQLNITPSMLPYRVTRDYYKGSAGSSVGSLLTLNVSDYMTSVRDELSDYATAEELNQLDYVVNGGSTSFKASGVVQDLSPMIRSGSVITSISGAEWSSVNLYDENGSNGVNIRAADLPYTTTRDYYKASTHVTGNPVLSITIMDLYSTIKSLFKDVPSAPSDVLTLLGNIALLKKASYEYLGETKNMFAVMQGLEVGDTFVLTENGFSTYTYDDFPVSEGDLVLLTTTGNTVNAKAYAIMDDEDVILEIEQGPINGQVLTMPQGAARMVVNSVADGTQGAIHVLAKTGEIDSINRNLYGYAASFKANGSPKVLTNVIKAGSIITSVTGGAWNSINLYDENEGNRTNISKADLPYTAPIDFYMGSTYISGSPTLNINIGGALDLSKDLYERYGGAAKAKRYDIGNHDNEFYFDYANIGRLVLGFAEIVPNFNVPSSGGFISTDIENTERRSEPVSDDSLMRAYAPYFYLDGVKRGTIVLFDTDGTPFIYDRNGQKRTLSFS